MSGDSRRIIGAANPFVLAELRAGKPIDWAAEEDSEKTISRLLDMPMERIVDPKFGSPIYAGVPLDFSKNRCGGRVDPAIDLRDFVDRSPSARRMLELELVSGTVLRMEPTNLRQLAADVSQDLFKDLKTITSPCDRQATDRSRQRAAEVSVAERFVQLAPTELIEAGKELGRLDREFLIIPPDWLRLVFRSDLNFGLPGEYFVDAPTATSPVQGALGDCWLIAAMASVAWTASERVAERIRRENLTGDVDAGDADFRFDLTDVLTISLGWITLQIPYVYPIWVGEEVPQAYSSYIYARSSVAGETWPAVMEKAVAVWRSGGDADFPSSADYNHLNGGDPAWAVHILLGGTPWYHWADADDAWSTIQSHCAGGRTTSALVAWTWGSSDDSPNKVDYGGAHLVANHAYSILGTWQTNNRQYVVLRNPWGTYEGTLNTHAGGWGTAESWGTATLNLPGNGVFALEIHTFREYFMGYGGSA